MMGAVEFCPGAALHPGGDGGLGDAELFEVGAGFQELVPRMARPESSRLTARAGRASAHAGADVARGVSEPAGGGLQSR